MAAAPVGVAGPWAAVPEVGVFEASGGGLDRPGPTARCEERIKFYGKLSVKNPASRGQVNLDGFYYGGWFGCLSMGEWDEFSGSFGRLRVLDSHFRGNDG